MKMKIKDYFIIFVFVGLYLIVATGSMINSIDFFRLGHNEKMSIAFAVAFELGQVASLLALVISNKSNKTMVWVMFITLTLFQMMANTYHVYANLEDYKGWIELFGLMEETQIFQKRILGLISGSILPLVALGFIKSLVDYFGDNNEKNSKENVQIEEIDENDYADDKINNSNNDELVQLYKDAGNLPSYHPIKSKTFEPKNNEKNNDKKDNKKNTKKDKTNKTNDNVLLSKKESENEKQEKGENVKKSGDEEKREVFNPKSKKGSKKVNKTYPIPHDK